MFLKKQSLLLLIFLSALSVVRDEVRAQTSNPMEPKKHITKKLQKKKAKTPPKQKSSKESIENQRLPKPLSPRKNDADLAKKDQENFEAIAKDLSAIHVMNSMVFHAHSHSHEGGASREGDQKNLPPPPPPPLEMTEHGMRFHFDKRPGMALVRLHGEYWLFFKGKHTLPLTEKLPSSVESMEDQSTEKDTIFKICTKCWPVITSEIHDWHIDFLNNPQTSRSKKVVNWPSKRDDPVHILLPSYTGEVPWMHPITKINYAIFTSRKQMGSFAPQEDFPQFTSIESYAGLGILPKTDSLVLKKDNDAEALLMYDSRGTFPQPTSYEADFFFTKKQSSNTMTGEIQHLRSQKSSPNNLFQEIQLLAQLNLFHEAMDRVATLEKLCANKLNPQQNYLDFVNLLMEVLEPTKEGAEAQKTSPSTLRAPFTWHGGCHPEFSFWLNLYHRRPQNYEQALVTFLPKYPNYIKNRVISLLLELPDEPQNIEKLGKLLGVEPKIVEITKLKMALMPPVDTIALEEILKKSKNRSIQAEITFELAKAKKKNGTWKAKDIIKNMTPFLLAFGDNEFDAKFLLGDAHMEEGHLTEALRLFREISLASGQQNELFIKIKEAYHRFFQNIFEYQTKESLKKDEKDDSTAKKDKTKEKSATKPSPFEVIAFYNEFGRFTSEGEEGYRIIQSVVEHMEKLSLLTPAIEILAKYGESHNDSPYKNAMYFKLAELHRENGNADGVEKMLDVIQGDLAPENQERVLGLRMDACLIRKDFSKALQLIRGKEDIFSLRQKCRVLWPMKDYGELLKTLISLIDKETNDKNARALDTAHLAAVNLLLSPHPFTFDDLRMRYGHLVKGTPFEKMFHVLSMPDQNIQNGLSQFDTIDDLINYAKNGGKE